MHLLVTLVLITFPNFRSFFSVSNFLRFRSSAKHCWPVFPGPTVSAHGAHEMRVVFHSDGFGTANGFDAHYQIRPALREEVPTKGARLGWDRIGC